MGDFSVQPVALDVPTTRDDPRLNDWYHTIELGNGLVSRGTYDHRPIVHRYGLPESLAGKTALDVGTANGFWAFEMERRGAEHVSAIDVASWNEFDWLPWRKPASDLPVDLHQSRFRLAHAMRGSRVEHRTCNVYDLSPETVGTFDVVFCGDLLLHLQNPVKAVVNIRSVTKEMAIIATLVESEIDERFPDKPWLSFGHRAWEENLGEACVYWHFSTRGLEELMQYCGFTSTRAVGSFALPPTPVTATAVVGYVQGAEPPNDPKRAQGVG